MAQVLENILNELCVPENERIQQVTIDFIALDFTFCCHIAIIQDYRYMCCLENVKSLL